MIQKYITHQAYEIINRRMVTGDRLTAELRTRS